MIIYLRNTLNKDSFDGVNLYDIMYVDAQSNYANIVTKTKSYLYSLCIYQIEEQIAALDTKMKFVRIHRSYIVNRDYVDRIYGNVLCIGNKEFMVAKSQRENVFKLFRFIC